MFKNWTNNCYFHTGTNDDNDWNKAWGWTTDILGKNSLRIVWRPLKGSTTKVQLGAYIHKDGVRFTFPNWDLGSYNWGSLISTWINHDGHNATFYTSGPTDDILQDQHWSQIIPFEKCTCMGYRQYPYFGGNMVAPHTMTIELI